MSKPELTAKQCREAKSVLFQILKCNNWTSNALRAAALDIYGIKLNRRQTGDLLREIDCVKESPYPKDKRSPRSFSIWRLTIVRKIATGPSWMSGFKRV